MKRLYKALLLYMVSISSYASCEVAGFDFIYEAKDKGLIYEARVAGGEGGCSVIAPSVVVSASINGQGVTCDVIYFAGGELRGGWKVQNIIFSGPAFNVVKKTWPGVGIETIVRARAGAGESKSLTVRKVILESDGEECSKWRDSL